MCAVLFATACPRKTDDVNPPGLQRLPALDSAPTTVEKTLLPAHAVESAGASNPSLVENQAAYLAAGYGVINVGAGEPLVDRTPDGTPPPPPGPSPRRLVRFAHLADLQLVDDESPTRLGDFDSVETDAALRPQDPHLCRMANAAVRTINALHHQDPVSFVLMGGDNVDSAQGNELDWVMGILDGNTVHCDSGDDDEMVPGAGNDPKDPFQAEGLSVPWKWVTGNHDALIQGNLPVNDETRATSVGNNAAFGTRDYLHGGAVDHGDFVIPDETRRVLSGPEMLQRVRADGDGHGITAANEATGRAFYTFDVEGTPLRFLILDTAVPTGAAAGVVHQAEIDALITPALDLAASEHKLVVLASHHSVTSLSDGGGLGGTRQVDAVSQDAWRAYVGGYPNVLFSMTAHSHEHRVRLQQTPQGGHWWEVTTASIADYPHQFRSVEIWDEDNGWLTLRTVAVDLSVENDPMAEQGRVLGYVDHTSGWFEKEGRGQVAERNVKLWIQKPAM